MILDSLQQPLITEASETTEETIIRGSVDVNSAETLLLLKWQLVKGFSSLTHKTSLPGKLALI